MIIRLTCNMLFKSPLFWLILNGLVHQSNGQINQLRNSILTNYQEVSEPKEISLNRTLFNDVVDDFCSDSENLEKILSPLALLHIGTAYFHCSTRHPIVEVITPIPLPATYYQNFDATEKSLGISTPDVFSHPSVLTTSTAYTTELQTTRSTMISSSTKENDQKFNDKFMEVIFGNQKPVKLAEMLFGKVDFAEVLRKGSAIQSPKILSPSLINTQPESDGLHGGKLLSPSLLSLFNRSDSVLKLPEILAGQPQLYPLVKEVIASVMQDWKDKQSEQNNKFAWLTIASRNLSDEERQSLTETHQRWETNMTMRKEWRAYYKAKHKLNDDQLSDMMEINFKRPFDQVLRDSTVEMPMIMFAGAEKSRPLNPFISVAENNEVKLMGPVHFAGRVLEPFVLEPSAVSGEKVLNPLVLSPVLLSPEVLNPTVLSPLVLSPFILTPSVLSPFVLSPAVLSPQILSPEVLSPAVLSPMVLSPCILSPEVLSPNVLSPLALSPFVLCPSVLSEEVLSPGVLSDRVLSPDGADPLG